MNRKLIYMGYILIGIAINGYFGIFLPADNPGTPKWAWYILAITGIGIVGLQTSKIPRPKRLKKTLFDLLFIVIFIFFALLPLPNGLNFLVGSAVGVYFLYYVIDKKLKLF